MLIYTYFTKYNLKALYLGKKEHEKVPTAEPAP